jgi:release factor glutamine methyltransferase
MATVRQLLDLAGELPGDSAARDAELLLGHCLGQSRSWLFTWPEREVPQQQGERYLTLLARRAAGEPVAYLIGSRGFWTLQLTVNRHTLIPRPETETLVEWALQLELPDTAAVLDLGTGSGAIALALASERPGWRVQGVDASDAALEVARSNARRNGLQRVAFLHSDWFGGLERGARFDLLVGNPPYIDTADPHLEQGDLRFEPRAALAAQEQGLADLRAIVTTAPQFLRVGGWLLLEHGYQQGHSLRALLTAAGFDKVTTRQDLAGQDRISGGCWHAD